MKIIFLDIDGVLNCENAYRNGECQYQEWIWEDGRKDHYQRFCVRSKELLNKLIDETGAKIVISSTWRHSGIDFMKKVWDMEEMKNGVNFQMKKFQLLVISFSKYKCSHAKNQLLNLTRKIKNKVMGLDKSNQFQYRDHFCQKKRLIHLLSKKY